MRESLTDFEIYDQIIHNRVNNGNSSQKKSNKMQQCIKILFHIYMKLNMFWATHPPARNMLSFI